MARKSIISHPPGGATPPRPLSINWLPWMDEALRLYFEKNNMPVIARKVGQEQSVVEAVMQSPEWQGRARSMQARLQALYEARMLELWDLSPEFIAALRNIVKEYDELRAVERDPKERQKLVGFRALRKDAKEVSEGWLNRIGLKAPDKVEVKSDTHHTETTEQKLTYEQRIELIKRYEAAGLQPDQDLLDIKLEQHDG